VVRCVNKLYPPLLSAIPRIMPCQVVPSITHKLRTDGLYYTKTRSQSQIHLNILPLPPERTLNPSTDPTDPNRYRSIAPDRNLNEFAAARRRRPAGQPRLVFLPERFTKCLTTKLNATHAYFTV